MPFHPVDSWFTLNRLSVNSSKTEYLLIGTQQQRAKISDSSLSFRSTALVPVSSARNLGVVFQSDLPLVNTFTMSVVPLFITSVNFAKSDLLLISIHLLSLQMLSFHPKLIIVTVFLRLI